jgi:signal transduction histidine kinase
MKIRWRLFLSHILAITAVVFVVALSVRSIAVAAVESHMGVVMMGMMSGSVQELERAVARGVTEALLWGSVAGVVAAIVASYAVSGYLTDTLRTLAKAARRIAAGEYNQRVEYSVEDEIGELARSFNEMTARLQRTESLRRELLANISHELRTPLTSIQGYMEGLSDGVVPAEPETFERVRQEAARLSRLVADIERLSTVEAGGEPLERRPLPAQRVVSDVVERLRPQFEQKPLELYTEFGADLPPVWADEDKLVQVLVNLLANAYNYTPPSGRVVVRVRVARATDRLLFQVEDDGIGIPPEDLPHIFERFYRVDKSRSAAGGGAGIGLAVVRSLVERMGGAVQAQSEPGKGTLVSFLLPVYSRVTDGGATAE